jgi:adenosine deaminase
MAEHGLKIMVNSDDPTMFHTDIGSEYARMAEAAEWPPARVREFVLNGIDGAWLEDGEKRRLRAEFERELDELEPQLEPEEA